MLTADYADERGSVNHKLSGEALALIMSAVEMVSIPRYTWEK
jgi:hypothetical protein